MSMIHLEYLCFFYGLAQQLITKSADDLVNEVAEVKISFVVRFYNKIYSLLFSDFVFKTILF